MSRLMLSLAVSDYDHVRDLVSGRVQPEGIELVPSVLNVEEIFYRTTHFRGVGHFGNVIRQVFVAALAGR